MRQLHRPGDRAEDAVVLIVTHKAAPADVAHATTRFAATGVLVGQPVAIRIEEV
jgi:homoserine dehydrogenase